MIVSEGLELRKVQIVAENGQGIVISRSIIIDISDLPSANYYAVISTDQGKVVKKFYKQD